MKSVKYLQIKELVINSRVELSGEIIRYSIDHKSILPKQISEIFINVLTELCDNKAIKSENDLIVNCQK